MSPSPKLDEQSKKQQLVRLRNPILDDGAGLWNLAKESSTLDLNSPYAYLMWCDKFAKTSLVAEIGGEPAAFLMGFHPPGQDDVLFVWQVAVAEKYRGRGLASLMLDKLIESTESIKAVEATVTSSNVASSKLFNSLAARHDCACSQREFLSADHFPGPGHESETLFHIGPIENN
jgi:L-2,4-diaminobutyric acid acetyltransferase